MTAEFIRDAAATAAILGYCWPTLPSTHPRCATGGPPLAFAVSGKQTPVGQGCRSRGKNAYVEASSFASSWFGWALDDPPLSWRRGLISGAVLSLSTAVAGGLLTWRYWSNGSVFNAATGRSFGIIVGIEVVLAALGAWFLASRHRSELVPPWIALVVGVHFFPLAPLLDYPLFYPLAVLVMVAALVSVPVARARSLTISAVTGLLTGSVLLAAALYSLITVVFST